MQNEHRQSRAGSVICRFRTMPKTLGAVVLAIPAVVAVTALGLPAATAAVGGSHAGAVHAQPVAAVRAHPSPDKALRAYFRAGYDYDDAVLLSRLWAHGTDFYHAKLKAGELLLHHGQVPIRPGQDAWHVSGQVARTAYRNNGYTPADADVLARLWRPKGGAPEAKTTAGRDLLAGTPLPPVPSHPVRHDTERNRIAVYLRSGFDYDDAVLLSRLWAHGMDPYHAKLKAGGELIHFVPVPIYPGQDAWHVGKDVARQAFANNGYTYDDAVALARVWHLGTPGSAKTLGGRKVLAGVALPPVPSHHGPKRPGPAAPGQRPAPPIDQAQLDAYAQAGYDYDDGVLLSRLWAHGTDVPHAKARAGDKLLHRQPLPIRHGQTAWTVGRQTAIDAFINNGYGYDDAVKLSKVWKQGDIAQVKVTAGQKLLAGLSLPLQ